MFSSFEQNGKVSRAKCHTEIRGFFRLCHLFSFSLKEKPTTWLVSDCGYYTRVKMFGQIEIIVIWCNLQKIAGADQSMQQTFTDSLGTEVPYTVERVKEAIKAVNESRWDRLFLLLEYIEDQGEVCNSGIKLTWNIITLSLFVVYLLSYHIPLYNVLWCGYWIVDSDFTKHILENNYNNSCK